MAWVMQLVTLLRFALALEGVLQEKATPYSQVQAEFKQGLALHWYIVYLGSKEAVFVSLAEWTLSRLWHAPLFSALSLLCSPVVAFSIMLWVLQAAQRNGWLDAASRTAAYVAVRQAAPASGSTAVAALWRGMVAYGKRGEDATRDALAAVFAPALRFVVESVWGPFADEWSSIGRQGRIQEGERLKYKHTKLSMRFVLSAWTVAAGLVIMTSARIAIDASIERYIVLLAVYRKTLLNGLESDELKVVDILSMAEMACIGVILYFACWNAHILRRRLTTAVHRVHLFLDTKVEGFYSLFSGSADVLSKDHPVVGFFPVELANLHHSV